MYVTMEINETLGNKYTQSERGELWVVKHASELNVLASFPAHFQAPGNEAANVPAECMQVKLPGILGITLTVLNVMLSMQIAHVQLRF